ncbi:MAG TPA: DegT/DnrJ/EryC1/StrS family aminotransferase [Pyrinomonadaceae bacterium]|nr:DegT/DnrJ/EryC1/StrS family aminotransferase [Pyrinomonadaceae bacterium]
MERLLVSGPSITQKEIDYVTDAVTNAWYGNANIYHERFERAFAEYLGRRHAIALPSCTSAIHLALDALGIGPGDEVVLPDATWIASSAPISYVAATPVFADIDERTWCLSAASLEQCITSRTRAVIAVDLYGNMPEMDAILEVAQRHNIAVIEDSAEAIGSEYKGRLAGNFGAASVFSFHGSKTLTTGEGGMLVTDDDDLRARALFLRDHGRKPGDKMFFNHEVAYKYKMSSMQAALGLAQLERIEELLEQKRRIFSWYEKNLRGIDGLQLNYGAPETRNVYWMVTVVLDPRFELKKEELMRLMDGKNIDCRPFFFPLSSIPAYRDTKEAGAARVRNRVAYSITPYGINLPSGLNLNEEKVAYVCEALKAVLNEKPSETRLATI